MLTEAQARQSSMLDELLDEDLADGLRHIDWLVERVDSQVSIRSALRFAPHPRPWHAEWNTLAA
jgi:hypothetical protein